jgi:hypothetical protein
MADYVEGGAAVIGTSDKRQAHAMRNLNAATIALNSTLLHTTKESQLLYSRLVGRCQTGLLIGRHSGLACRHSI